MRMKLKTIPAKVGTQPWLIVLYPRVKVEVGRRITFREAIVGAKWLEGVVDKVEPLTITLI